MKRLIKLLPIVAVLFMGVLSCDKEKEDEKVSGQKIVTLSADKGPLMVATLSGCVSGLEGVAMDFECGIEYSTEGTFTDSSFVRRKVDKKYSEDTYSITISGLQPGKKYFYRAYYVNQLLIYYGEIKTFTFEWEAPVITTLGAELDESSGVVTLKGLIKDKRALVRDLSEYYPISYYGNNGYYGIDFSTTESFEINSTTRLYPNMSTDSLNNANNDSIICTIPQFNYGSTYYYRAFFNLGEIQSYGQVKSFKFEWNGPKMVDLGLSVKWATYNVGATNPWDYGDYFAWGETEPYYEGYSYKYFRYDDNPYYYLSIIKYNNDGKYGTIDNKTTLDLEDDVAHVKWGENWRLPTQSEIEELTNYDNCTWTWITQKGVNGFLVTSRKSGYEGASIFLPVAGHFNAQFDIALGYYWSSSLYPKDPTKAWALLFDSACPNTMFWTEDESMILPTYFRSSGLSVRPVCP